jgi:hypothetical protein
VRGRRRARAAWPLGAALALGAAASDCGERIDGTPIAPAALGEAACRVDLDCGAGRHCGDGDVCAIDCVTSADCGYALASPDAPNDLECSLCGRCVAPNVRDSRCLGALDQPCKTGHDCELALGSGYGCDARGTCARECASDEDCRGIGRGFGCGDAHLCVRACFRDQDCAYFGWQYACSLPAGVDPKVNAEAFQPVFGQCLPTADLGFEPVSAAAPASAYQGIWGMLLVSAMRVTGVPLFSSLDSVAVERVLAKATSQGGDVTWQLKWCSIDIQNFAEDDGPPPSLFQIVVPDANVDSVLVTTSRALGVPPLAPSAAFRTQPMIDVRGARLANPATDPLPTHLDLTHQWDQDRDGNPGMTVDVTGLISGRRYQAQRTLSTFDALVVDRDHLHGLFALHADQTSLGASDPALVDDAVTSQHPDADRSYFRAQRVPDTASCADVVALAKPGGWLEFHPHFDPNAKP